MRTQRQLYSYDSQEPMKVIGTFMDSVTIGTHCEDAEFTVVAERTCSSRTWYINQIRDFEDWKRFEHQRNSE